MKLRNFLPIWIMKKKSKNQLWKEIKIINFFIAMWLGRNIKYQRPREQRKKPSEIGLIDYIWGKCQSQSGQESDKVQIEKEVEDRSIQKQVVKG